MSQVYVVNTTEKDRIDKDVFVYFNDLHSAVEFMKSLGRESSLKAIDCGVLVCDKYPINPVLYCLRKFDSHFIFMMDQKTLFNNAEEARFKERKLVWDEMERKKEEKQERKQLRKLKKKRSDDFRYPLRRMPIIGWCDYPEQFSTKCPEYNGHVNFKKIESPDFVFLNTKQLKNRGSMDGKKFVKAKYIGNHIIKDGTPLKETGLKELWIFETSLFTGTYAINHDMYNYRSTKGKLYNPKDRDIASDSSSYSEVEFDSDSYWYDGSSSDEKDD